MNSSPNFEQPVNRTIQVVGIGRRSIAYLIDSFILSVVIGGISLVSILSVREGAETVTQVNLVVQGLGFLISVAYFVVFWAMTGQTLGKMVMGIKVISTDGSPITFGKAILRYVGYLISSLPLSLGFIWAAFDARRQGWHDKISGTYVVPQDTHFSLAETVTFIPSDSNGAAIVIAMLLLIAPILIILLIFIGLLVFASSSGVAPFIYTLF